MKRLFKVALLACFPSIAGEVALEWDKSPEPVSTYIVRYGPSAANKIASEFVGDTNKVYITNVPDGIEVFSEVVAVSMDGRVSDPSNTFRTLANTKPIAPMNLRAVTNVYTITATVTNIVTFQTTPQ